MNAAPGDLVFLITNEHEISFHRIPKDLLNSADNPVRKLACLVGVQRLEGSQGALLLRIGWAIGAIGIDNHQAPDLRMQIWKRLETRGEKTLASLLMPD